MKLLGLVFCLFCAGCGIWGLLTGRVINGGMNTGDRPCVYRSENPLEYWLLVVGYIGFGLAGARALLLQI